MFHHVSGKPTIHVIFGTSAIVCCDADRTAVLLGFRNRLVVSVGELVNDLPSWTAHLHLPKMEQDIRFLFAYSPNSASRSWRIEPVLRHIWVKVGQLQNRPLVGGVLSEFTPVRGLQMRPLISLMPRYGLGKLGTTHMIRDGDTALVLSLSDVVLTLWAVTLIVRASIAVVLPSTARHGGCGIGKTKK